jgi:hypothetical protein
MHLALKLELGNELFPPKGFRRWSRVIRASCLMFYQYFQVFLADALLRVELLQTPAISE